MVQGERIDRESRRVRVAFDARITSAMLTLREPRGFSLCQCWVYGSIYRSITRLARIKPPCVAAQAFR